MKAKNVSIIVVLVLLLFSLGANIYLLSRTEKTSSLSPYDVSGADAHPLLSRRIFIDNFNDILINFMPLRTQLRTMVKNLDPTGKSVGIYFEYLPSGVSIGVNDTETFATASLIKVPVVMAVYKEVERGTLALDQSVELKETDLDKYSGELYKKGAGSTITIQELIEASIIDSDNTAYKALLRTVGGDKLTDVYNSLDVQREIGSGTIQVTPKHYSSIVRSLFLSSFLSKASSQQLLEILTQTKASGLIPAGVPAGIKVAHKFGIVKDESKPGEDTLSDCGIVYAPDRSYLICIMVSQRDADEAKNIIREISKSTYEFVTSANSAK